MTKVYFIRHAEPNYSNHDDLLRELTPKGMEDRKIVTECLSNKKIDVVLSSPYKRAVMTLEDFAGKYGFKIETINDFHERVVGNEWIDNFFEFSKNQWADFDYKLEGYQDGSICSKEVIEAARGLSQAELTIVAEDAIKESILYGKNINSLMLIFLLNDRRNNYVSREA